MGPSKQLLYSGRAFGVSPGARPAFGRDRTVARALADVLERALPELVPPGADAGQAAVVILAAREGLLARTAAGGAAAEELLAATSAVLSGLLGH
ncbi:hypothetical protein ACFVXG_38610 [Kitasatospora sp. NPDC058162]|uniref:hypothetical protein n=1 Tax=Kitasatospora sp. NPDC058162 TaxID=3346362 RepID=UPI0036D84C88